MKSLDTYYIMLDPLSYRGAAIIKSFGEIIQDLVLFEGSGIIQFSGAQNKK